LPRDAHDPTHHLEHASNGEHHRQPNYQNREWKQQRNAGRTSERHEALKERSVSAARARHVKHIGRDCSCGSICDCLETLSMRFHTSSWARTHDAAIPRWRVTGGKRIRQNLIERALDGYSEASFIGLFAERVDADDRRCNGCRSAGSIFISCVKHVSSSRRLSALIALDTDLVRQLCAPIEIHDQRGRNYRRRRHQTERSDLFGQPH